MASFTKSWITTCKLLSFYGADPVSAEMALTIVARLKLSGRFQIASAVYLASFWGSQSGRTDIDAKATIMDFFKLNSYPKSLDMKKFGKEQIKIFKKLNFNVKKYGDTSIEILFQEGRKNKSLAKECLALTFWNGHLDSQQRASILRENGVLSFSKKKKFAMVMALAGRLMACYVRRSKEEEAFCSLNIRKKMRCKNF